MTNPTPSWSEKVREEAESVHALILKGVLTPHQLYLWVKPLIEEAKKSEREKIFSAIEDYFLSSYPIPDAKVLTGYIRESLSTPKELIN